MLLRIWFNRTYATYYRLLNVLAEDLGSSVTLIGTHANPTSPVLQACHEAYSELDALSAESYVEKALVFCHTHSIDVLWPTFHQEAVVAAEARFNSAGVKVVSPGLEAINAFRSKSEGYKAASALGLKIPMHRVVATKDEFLQAWEELRAETRNICMKPNSGAGADGFKIIVESPLSLSAFSSAEAHLARLSHLVEALDATPTFEPQILMPLLPGDEYSIDVLAHEGNIVNMYPRRKPVSDRYTELMPGHELEKDTRILVENVKMSGITNVQFLDDGDGNTFLLEVNTRAAGGLHHWYSTVGNLPLAALKLALGEPLPELNDPQPGKVFVSDESIVFSPK